MNRLTERISKLSSALALRAGLNLAAPGSRTTDKKKRKELLDFLDRKAFDPVLRASREDYTSQEEKDKLEYVQKATQREKKRYHDDYGTAEEIRDNFLDDIESAEAKKVGRMLDQLKLPTLAGLKPEFLEEFERI